MTLGSETGKSIQKTTKTHPDNPPFLENQVSSTLLHIPNTWSVFGEWSWLLPWLKRTETYCGQSCFLTVLWRALDGEGTLCINSPPKFRLK